MVGRQHLGFPTDGDRHGRPHDGFTGFGQRPLHGGGPSLLGGFACGFGGFRAVDAGVQQQLARFAVDAVCLFELPLGLPAQQSIVSVARRIAHNRPEHERCEHHAREQNEDEFQPQ